MNNVDYTKLRSGRQININMPVGYTEQLAAPITNSFRDQAKQELIQTGAQTLLPFAKNVYGATSAYLSAAKSAAEPINRATQGLSQIAEFGGAPEGFTAAGIKETGEAAAKQAASQAGKTAAQKALGGVNVAMNAYNALAGGYKTYLNWNDSDTLGGSDLLAGSAKGTQYANGVAYSTMNGFDNNGFKDYVSAQNDAQKLGGIMSGAQAGMGAGGLIGMVGGPLGSLIGSGIGGVIGGIVGGLGGHHARERRRRLYAEAVRNYANAAEAYNMQNESVAATQGMRNEYYATHADKGIQKCDTGVALVNDREVVGNAYKDQSGNLRISDVHSVSSPFGRADVKLEKVDADSGFVIGHKKDEDGIELNEKAKIYEEMFNSGIPQWRNIGEQGLLQLLNVQPHIKDNNPKPQYAKYIENTANGMPMADEGKSIKDKMKTGKINLPKLDLNGYAWSLFPSALGFFNAQAKEKEAERMPIEEYGSYLPNPLIQQATALMSNGVNVKHALDDINTQMRHQLYYNNQAPMSSGARMAMNANLANNVMKNRTWTQLSKIEQENKLNQMFADFLAKSGEIEQKMMMTSRDKTLDNRQKANAAKLARIDTAGRSKMDAIYKGFENAFNTWMFNKNTALFQQELNDEKRKTLGNIEANAGNNYNKYSILPTIDKKFLNLSLNPFKQS